MKVHTWQDWAMLLALTVMWGTAFTLTKVAVTDLSPTLVVAARLLIGTSILLIVVAAVRIGVPRDRRRWLFFFLIGLFGNALPFSLISWGQKAIDSGQAGILMACMPLFTLLLAHYALPDEPLTLQRVIGFVLGFAGIVVLMGPESLFDIGGSGATLAQLAVLGGAICYAVSAVLARLQPPGDATATAAATTLIAVGLTLPWLTADVGLAGQILHAPLAAWSAVLLLGIFSTAIAAVVYFRLVRRAGPSFVSQLNYLIPLWAVAIGVLFLDERPDHNHLYALLLILAGIFVSQIRPRVRRRSATEAGDSEDWEPLQVRIETPRRDR
jgi:drug/metabolite transporter (DMT)-like permease